MFRSRVSLADSNLNISKSIKSSPYSIVSFQENAIISVVRISSLSTGVIGIDRFGAPGIITAAIFVSDITPALVELTGIFIVKLPTPPVICWFNELVKLTIT